MYNTKKRYYRTLIKVSKKKEIYSTKYIKTLINTNSQKAKSLKHYIIHLTQRI